MIATVNTTKYTTEKDLTNKKEKKTKKKNKHTYTQMASTYLKRNS